MELTVQNKQKDLPAIWWNGDNLQSIADFFEKYCGRPFKGNHTTELDGSLIIAKMDFYHAGAVIVPMPGYLVAHTSMRADRQTYFKGFTETDFDRRFDITGTVHQQTED